MIILTSILCILQLKLWFPINHSSNFSITRFQIASFKRWSVDQALLPKNMFSNPMGKHCHHSAWCCSTSWMKFSTYNCSIVVCIVKCDKIPVSPYFEAVQWGVGAKRQYLFPFYAYNLLPAHDHVPTKAFVHRLTILQTYICRWKKLKFTFIGKHLYKVLWQRGFIGGKCNLVMLYVWQSGNSWP